MKKALTSAMNFSQGKEVKINYEELKNYMGYEDIFYEMYLMPALKDLGLEHRFSGAHIIVKKKGRVE